MFLYCLSSPLDFWSGWQKPEDVFRVSKHEYGYDSDRHDARDWYRLWDRAQKLAKLIGWDGDIREGPFVTVLPDEGGGLSPVLIAWKQDNNGITFVASPYRLPWYEHEEDPDTLVVWD